MVYGVCATDEGRSDPDDFGQKLRRFALDAYDVLSRSDSPLDELIGLHGRIWYLVREAHGAQSTEIHCWLLAVRREIDAKLETSALEREDFALIRGTDEMANGHLPARS